MGTRQKISEAIALLSQGGVGKKNWNDQQKFWFRGIDDILGVLSPVLAKTGLVIVPKVKSIESSDFVSSNQKQTKFNRVMVTVDYDIVSGDDVGVTCSFAGEAMDTGDKATAKAMSMAYKQMAVQVFCIPVVGEDDADNDSPGHEQEEAPIRAPTRVATASVDPVVTEESKGTPHKDESRPASAGEIAFVKRKMAELQANEAAVLKWAGIGSFDEMTSNHFLLLKDRIEARMRE